MGRSPLFEHFVHLIEARKVLPGYEGLELHDRIRLIVHKPGEEGNGGGEIQKIHKILGVSRSCSTYGMEEVYLPKDDQVFTLWGKQKYIFWRVFDYDPWRPGYDTTMEKIFLMKKIGERLSSDIHSHIKSFLCTEYDCILVDIVDNQDKMVTFIIRSDGSLLNIEDFSVRGQLVLIQKLS